MRVDLDHGKVVQLVDADQLGRKDATVVERDIDLHRTVDDVIVGEDVAVGREDHAAADAVLNLSLLRHLLHRALRPKAEEATELGRQILHAVAGVGAIVVCHRPMNRATSPRR